MTDEVRKLYRNSSDKKIAGVCSGVAHYLNIDATVLRIITLIAFLCGSLGLWPYLIIWLLTSEKPLGK